MMRWQTGEWCAVMVMWFVQSRVCDVAEYEQPVSEDGSMGFQREIETTNSERESGRSDR